MGGLYTGLYYAKCQRVFAAAADMPFISPAAIRVVLAAAELGDIVIPEVQGAPLAPAPEIELPLTPLVSEAPPPPPPSSEPARRVAMPGAPVAAVPPPAPPPPADTGARCHRRGHPSSCR